MPPSPLLVPRRRLQPWTALVLVLSTAACASYPERTDAAFRAFQGGQFEESRKRYADPDVTDSAFLSGAEAGMVALVAGDWAAAQEDLDAAAAAFEDLERRALVSASSLAEGLSSWALNDTSLPYRGEGFERVYVRACLALAYLAQGRLDGVWVEVQRGNAMLEAEEELYETEYAAGGLGHFISATAYEMLGRLDDAYIDYRRMEEKKVGTRIAGRALVRIANELGRADDAQRWEEKYGPDLGRPEGAASIVVIAGLDTGPYKRGAHLWVPTSDGVIPFAAPGYVVRPRRVFALRLVLGTGETVLTDELEDVTAVAEKNLGDRLLWIATKSIARGVLKRELTKALEDQHGLGGRVVGDVFAIVTERSDLRAWQSLPAAWHAARMFVPPGVHALRLEAVGGQDADLGTFELEPGETLVILARTLEGRLYPHAIGGKPVASADPATIP